MKKWQEERNYRRVRSEGGEVIANIITVDGMDVEVPEDVYLAYAQADRRERYITEEQSSGKLLSLEQMEEDALLPDYVGAETAPSAETEALEREELRNLAEQKQILLLALLSLKDTDRELINALFFDGASTREYAQRMGVSQRAVIKRRDRILRDLKKFFENSSKYWNCRFMYFHVYLIYRFTRTFTDHSSVITRCWGFELQNGKSSLKSPQTLATQDFAPASFLSTPDMKTT